MLKTPFYWKGNKSDDLIISKLLTCSRWFTISPRLSKISKSLCAHIQSPNANLLLLFKSWGLNMHVVILRGCFTVNDLPRVSCDYVKTHRGVLALFRDRDANTAKDGLFKIRGWKIELRRKTRKEIVRSRIQDRNLIYKERIYKERSYLTLVEIRVALPLRGSSTKITVSDFLG